MKVYIPSYNRWGRVTTHRIFSDLDYKIVVCKSQEEEYLKYHSPDELIVIPDEKDGSVGKKRNAILDIMAIEDGYGIIADDDLLGIRKTEEGRDLTSDEIINTFANLFEMAFDLGVHYVGLSNTDDVMKYRGDFQPFSLTKMFYGIVGVIENGIRYDTSLIRGEDVDFYYKQIYYNRLVLRDNRYRAYFDECNKKTGVGKSDKDCSQHYKALQKRYGKKLVRLYDNGVIKGVSSPIKGV